MTTEFDRTSDFFTAFRKDYGFPYFYREQPLDWFSEVGMWGVGIGYITAVLAITVIIAFLGTRGYSRWRVTLQMIISLAIGFSIIICVTGIEWQIATFSTTDTAEGHELEYNLHIGLNQANISMARMEPPSRNYIEYHNVKIGWLEVYQAEMEYREALMRGWPLGILRIARYISADMGGMRYMRAFRWSGYAAWILLWAGFAAWLLANVLMGSNVSYAAAFLLLTGILQVLACIVYSEEQPNDFYIPMDDGKGTKLRLTYDWMFWLTLFMGIFVILMSVIILVLDYLRPEDMNKFFGTTSEFHSPFGDVEIVENQNKDIKGMIRNLSTKRRKSEVGDLGRKTSMAVSRFNANGHDNSAFVSSMDIIEEGMAGERKNGGVPDIQVEMVDIKLDQEEDAPNNNSFDHGKSSEENEHEVESEVDSEKDSNSGSQHSTMSAASADERPRASIASTTVSDERELIQEDQM